MDYLQGLNDRQKEAVLHKDGPLLIVAGAGAGKTKTITHRIAYLIAQGVAPESILAVTFTNKAAKEMKERVESLVDFSSFDFAQDLSPKGRPTISTFHSLGVKILKENATTIGLSRFFTILDDGDSMSIIKESMKELGIDPKATAPRAVKSVISKNKNNFVSPEEFAATIRSHVGQTTLAIWRKYEAKKSEEGALDFDDLLLKTVILLDTHPEILQKYQERFRYIHIDEYQDTNKVQYLLTKMLAEKYKNICVVGDSDQNIYSWRGADIVNILNFEEDYPSAKVVLLEENYRSTKNILGVANAVIKKNTQRKEKNLFTTNSEGEPISIFEAYNDRVEAEFVADKIVEMIDKGTRPEDIAVLYRANFQSRIIEESMLRYSIPYQVLGVKFFDRKEVKDTLSYLRLSLNRDSMSDLKRAIGYPKRGIGAATVDKIVAGQSGDLSAKTLVKVNAFYDILDKIKDYAENHLPSETIKFLIKASGIESELLKSNLEEDLERLENIKELVTFASKYDEFVGLEGVEKLLEESALVSDQDTLEKGARPEQRRGVKLMTVHASKGLEFDHVFVVGLESELFPHTRADDTDLDVEEERRLFYVAITRAKKKLHLSYATLRMLYGETKLQSPSTFLYDIPEELVWREERSSSGLGDNVFYLD
jgi:DNA helicase-2/ATP-dependent DNA helicase PcrA